MFSSDQGVQLSSIAVAPFPVASFCRSGDVSIRLSRLELANDAVFVRVTIAWRVGRMPDSCARNP